MDLVGWRQGASQCSCRRRAEAQQEFSAVTLDRGERDRLEGVEDGFLPGMKVDDLGENDHAPWHTMLPLASSGTHGDETSDALGARAR